MSVVEDKAYEDQIERMKMKNQLIFERFQASEEDRKRAESSGSAINKNQNVQIRLRNNEQSKQRKKSNPPPVRPKSFHEASQYKDDSNHVAYNQFNESRKQGKFNRNTQEIDDDVAYQDYFHFQQTHRSKTDYSYSNRQNYHQSKSVSYPDDNNGYKPSYRDYQRSTSQKLSKSSPRFNQNNLQNTRVPKLPVDQSIYKLDNNKSISKEIHTKSNNNNVKNKTKFKLNNNNNQNVDPSGDKKLNNKVPSTVKKVLDDEYIDDTLEDLEQYRLKVDMEDFTVMNPESPNPILSIPLTSWTNDTILMDPEKEENVKPASDQQNNETINIANKSTLENLVNVSPSVIENLKLASDQQNNETINIADKSTLENLVNVSPSVIEGNVHQSDASKEHDNKEKVGSNEEVELTQDSVAQDMLQVNLS